ncbi:hypothetical protein B0F90DRAFT_1820237 [Multifurca ochricompacta]|uniref:Uncharacterized protein n=1 Tax=Multifurca ochricompacta TaxID=376703 RepID=A0AAD4LZV9_9AGAM|nr:hypothetical protein B0F90DRAFT_1820237 [Multifurca ochricompacta]
MDSLTSSLTTQSSSSGQPTASGDPIPSGGALAPTVDTNPPPVTPAKRGPGRPKGSGVKKHVDPATPLPPKRPVGRPRKDGLPAGSVPRGAPSSVSRKRKVAAPGDFATPSTDNGSPQSPTPTTSAPPFSSSVRFLAALKRDGALIPHHQPAYSNYTYPTPTTPAPQQPWSTTYSTLSAALQYKPTETAASPQKTMHAVDPVLHDDWPELLRMDANALLQSLVSSLQSLNSTSRSGMNIEDSFKFHINTLSPQEGTGPIPQLYSFLKTFWLPWSPTYFALTASSLSSPTPPEHRFFYWDPLPLVFNGIACPFCTVPLLNRGCIRSAPTKVYDLGRPFFLIGCEYACNNMQCKGRNGAEGRRFASTDPVVIRALPPVLRDELPVTFLAGGTADPQSWNWQPIGVSKSLWAAVVGCIGEGLSKEATLRIVRATQQSFPVPSIPKDDSATEESPEEMELQADAMHVDEPAHGTPEGAPYAETWKGHPASVTSQPEQNASSAPTAPSTTAHVPPHPHAHTSVSAPYGYPQATGRGR